MQVSPQRLGMIGCGLIARAHGIAAQRAERRVRFAACSSRNADAATSFADEFGCSASYTGHLDMLRGESLDGVVIATPPDSHADIIADCVRAGIQYILCEKPLSATASEARRIKALAESENVTVLEGFMYRHHPQIAVLRELVASGELGRIDQLQCNVNMLDASELNAEALAPNWRRDAHVGGVMHDFLCYPIDMANLLIGKAPARVLARSFASPSYGTPYRVFGLLEYDDGAVASIAASRLADFAQPLFVACERGSIRLDTAFNPIGNTQLNIQTSEGLIGRRYRSIPVSVPDPSSERLIDLTVFTWQLEHFVDVMTVSEQAIMSLDESLANSLTRDAVIESSRTNTWCAVSK